MKKIVLLLLFGITLISFTAIAAPIVVIKGPKGLIKTDQLPKIVNDTIKEQETKQPDLYKIIIYPYADYTDIYLLSGKSWKATKLRINVKNQSLALLSNDPEPPVEGKCPDESVQFVAISAYPGVAEVDQAIKIVSDAASKKYKTMTILSEQADAQTYKNWFSCSNLKGFYSIGHGSNEEMIVGNGEVVNQSFFQQEEFESKFKDTTLVINSCELYNYPFGSEILFGNALDASVYKKYQGPHAYQYVSGYTGLKMVVSELSSACFMKEALNGASMNYDTLRKCIGDQDLHYQDFGIAYPGRKLKL